MIHSGPVLFSKPLKFVDGTTTAEEKIIVTRENPLTVGNKKCQDCSNRFRSFFCTTCQERFCIDHFEDEKVHEHKRDSIQKHRRMTFDRLSKPAIVGRTV